MSIDIYTYEDPYKLTNEEYWDDIKDCPYFCVAQTTVNGLRAAYGKEVFHKGRVTNITDLIELFFEKWESTECIIKQHTAIDNVILSKSIDYEEGSKEDNVKKSFLQNREEIFKSIRTMFELGITSTSIERKYLTPEQLFLVEIFEALNNTPYVDNFNLTVNYSESVVDNILETAMSKRCEDLDISAISLDRVVIHGVHQFTPLILRLIEYISRYKRVILLFNYQKQYKSVYQTWMDIYSTFENVKLKISTVDGFVPKTWIGKGYEGNVVADALGKLVEGEARKIAIPGPIDILQFDNMTEFANYVADIYDASAAAEPDNPIRGMKEQFYSADRSVNDILKTYYPEQFGERLFLDYPLGKFFISIANMWDEKNNTDNIQDLNDVKVCLQSSILQEKYPGQLSTIYRRIEALFEGCTTLEQMIKRLERVSKYDKKLKGRVKDSVKRISYYEISDNDRSILKQALEDLKKITVDFYKDFAITTNNFKAFYDGVKGLLKDKIDNTHSLNEEFKDIIIRVLKRLDEVKDVETNASFDCLKATMAVYLQQENKIGNHANWIVRGFEQIDGDILLSKFGADRDITYHFACLSDDDINSNKVDEFSWPLDSDFFLLAQSPVDWKYRVFVKSREEYKNFKRCALIYGLEFNRTNYKLSYVKRIDSAIEQEPYFLLKVLGLKEEEYSKRKTNVLLADSSSIDVQGADYVKFEQLDYNRFKVCKYRFLLESILEGDTIYKDGFLQSKYLEAILENKVKENLAGNPKFEDDVVGNLNDEYENFKKYFPAVSEYNKLDITNNLRRRIMGDDAKTFPDLDEKEKRYMTLRELFLQLYLQDKKRWGRNILKGKLDGVSQSTIDAELSSEKLSHLKYYKGKNLWCQYCTNREICVEFYSDKE